MKIRREVTQDASEADVSIHSVPFIDTVYHCIKVTADTQATRQKPEVDFGPPLTDPESVEKVIRQAQLAILNPDDTSVDKYVNYDLDAGEVRSISFSRNVVVLEISGPELTDLTLVDLPGIFSSVSKGQDPQEITFVENLVQDYIKKDCLILLVITTKGARTHKAHCSYAAESQMISRIRRPSCLLARRTQKASALLAS